MKWENAVEKATPQTCLTQCRVTTNVQFVKKKKKPVFLKHNEATCDKKRYACNEV